MDLGAMAMKGYSTFPKYSMLESYHQIVLCHIQDTLLEGGSYSSAEMQSVYSTAHPKTTGYFDMKNKNKKYI